MRKILIVAVAALALIGCTSDAEKASQNLSKAADQFEVQRRIVGINGITDVPVFEVEGRCSITSDTEDRQLEITCKHADDDYRKHYIGLSDNVFYVVTQLEGLAVDVYRTRFIFKPENIIPDLDLVTG